MSVTYEVALEKKRRSGQQYTSKPKNGDRNTEGSIFKILLVIIRGILPQTDTPKRYSVGGKPLSQRASSQTERQPASASVCARPRPGAKQAFAKLACARGGCAASNERGGNAQCMLGWVRGGLQHCRALEVEDDMRAAGAAQRGTVQQGPSH